MRWAVAVAVVMVAACSPNDQVPVHPDARHGDGAVAADAPRADSRLDAFHGMPDASIDGPPLGPGLYPQAPVPAGFGWQSLQEYFHRSDSTTCTGQVTVALGDRALCYVGSDDDVHCAGSIYTHDYGAHFTALGQTGVDQILISPTANSATGNAICVHKRAGSIWCMGDYNAQGQFGNGTTTPSATFVQFGSAATSYTRLGGTSDTHCALDAQGHVACAGYSVHSSTPQQLAGAGHVSFYVDDFGSVMVDDATVFRISNGSPCTVHGDGLHCSGTQFAYGTAGQVVDGGIEQPIGGPAMGNALTCWLDPSGIAHCAVPGLSAVVFAAAPPLLALATNFYSDARCAVGNDGSLWCMGSNTHGELGTGTTSPLQTETRVAPPGTVKVACN